MDEDILEKLKTALDLVEKLKADNALIREDSTNLKSMNTTLQTDNSNLNKELTLISKEKNAMEDSYEKAKQFWKTKFDERDKELEALKLQTPSKR